MLKWIILATFVAGFTLGSMSGFDSSSARSRACISSGSTNTDNSDGGNDQTDGGTDGADNANSGGDTNANSGNSNGGDSNANTNSSGGNTNQNAADGNTNGSGNSNTNSGGSNSNTNSTNSNSSDNSNANANVNGFTIFGRFEGNSVCTRRESTGGQFSEFPATNVGQVIQYRDNFNPLFVTLIAYGGAPSQTLTQVAQGSEQTFNFTHSGKAVTMVARVQQASFSATQMRMVIAITWNSTGGALTEQGGGTQTTETRVTENGSLEYSSGVEYEVDLIVNGSPFFTVTQIIDCDGTLTRIPGQ